VHPVLGCVETIDRALKDVRDVQPHFMTVSDKAEALVALARLGDQVAALRMRLLATAEDVAAEHAARDAAAWLTTTTRGDRRANRAEQELATALEVRWTQVAAGLGDGRVNLAQAKVITHALEDLPETDVPEQVLADAEAHLVELAATYGPEQLAVLGRKILEVVAPDTFEAQEAKKLEQEEQRARETTSYTSKKLGDGSTRISLKIPDAAAARLRGYLEAFTSPRHDAMTGDHVSGLGEGDRIPTKRKLGQAFCAFLEAADPDRLPLQGGDATTLLVTTTLDALRDGLAAAGVSDTDRISAAEARRLACTAKIIPVVLGGNSEVLDLGRTRRLFTPAQRKALQVRDRSCRAEGCTIPAAWTEAHHLDAWSRGGNTDLDNAVLLCSWHHHRAHDTRYRHDHLPNGDIRFHRRR
jgi:hypothetical protein